MQKECTFTSSGVNDSKLKISFHFYETQKEFSKGSLQDDILINRIVEHFHAWRKRPVKSLFKKYKEPFFIIIKLSWAYIHSSCLEKEKV